MIRLRNTTIDVIEYLTLKRVLSTTNHGAMNVNGKKFAFALARANVTSHLDNKDLWGDSMLYTALLFNLINDGFSSIRLKKSKLSRLRDFTKTGRIGELSQGLVWLYMEETSPFNYLADFNFFCELNGINVSSNKSTPDYIALKANTSNICIVEAKGKIAGSSESIKSKLKKGLKQCKNGERIVRKLGTYHIEQKLCFCTEFSTDLDTVDSKLYFIDPLDLDTTKGENDLIIRLHYASWFYTLADFENATKLINRESIVMEKNYTREFIGGNEFWLIDTERIINFVLNNFKTASLPFFYFDSFLFHNVRFGISVKVVEALQKAFISECPTFEPNKNDNITIYRDGTTISNQ